ncbi:MAG: TonB-dependent receptor [Bacteroidetes bacterium MedPE-SWsnd-G1]|nr:MAG: TonB-dependent receptor [Bacteroidetes bacterium MedPE-SWsnd-G1]
MKKIYISLFMLCMSVMASYSQSLSSVKGTVSDSHSAEPIANVLVKIIGADLHQLTQVDGSFELKNVPIGEQLVQIELEGYYTQNFPVVIKEGESVDLGVILLNEAVVQINDLSVISLTDDQLSEDEGGADNTAGLLQASRDIFLNTAAFEFSPTFFRARGYNSENGSLLINGIEMNKLYNGRPQWSNWGGLNDVMRNQVFTNGLAASDYTFGGVAGTNNITMRASEYGRGGRVSLASSNRSYSGRLMVSYSSGLSENGWAYSFSASRRFAHEGYNDASLYDSNSFFAAIEKVINDKHSLNFTAFYTPNRRGKSSPNTQEVYDLKGTRYNAYWGKQRGEKRNSRERHIEEPVFMLNHYWDINEKTTLNSNVAFQTGKVANSRIDHGGMNLVTDSSGNDYLIGGGSNPDPTYYQKLPSYFLRDVDNPDYAGAYLAMEDFQDDGQMDWQSMYDANLNSANLGGNSTYALYDDRNDDTQFTFNSILRTELTDNIDLNGSVSYRNLNSENFAAIKDLLGGTGFLNVDSFSETLDESQNDLRNPNSIVQEGDRFKYNYEIDASTIDAFAQAQFQYNKVDFYISGKFASTNYQRNGLYENGRFPGERSYGKSEKLSFSNASFKGGLTYKISGRHLVNFNAGYLSNAPTIRNSFSNSRENNDVVKDLTSEKITTADLSYILRTPKVQARITGFYTEFADATEISFYYADGISFVNEQGAVESSAFVQEVLSGIDKRNIGMELGLSYQITPTIKLKGAAAIGDYIYNNNPNLYLTSDAFDGNLVDEPAYLKNYHVAGGPQQAMSIGFEYRDPNYWWFGATGNYFSNGYLDISPLSRTSNFSTDPSDGQPFNDYDPEIAKQLLAQEQFDSYFLVNAVGGKSWRVDDYFIGFFASINNILNTKYKTGGFEQSRNANYRVLKDDQEREKPIFGPKYWYGYGATYYLNVYFRF